MPRCATKVVSALNATLAETDIENRKAVAAGPMPRAGKKAWDVSGSEAPIAENEITIHPYENAGE